MLLRPLLRLLLRQRLFWLLWQRLLPNPDESQLPITSWRHEGLTRVVPRQIGRVGYLAGREVDLVGVSWVVTPPVEVETELSFSAVWSTPRTLPVEVETKLVFRRRLVIPPYVAVFWLQGGQERQRWEPLMEQLVRRLLVRVRHRSSPIQCFTGPKTCFSPEMAARRNLNVREKP